MIRYENILVLLPIFPSPHRRTGPLSFRGAEVSCPNILSIACLKIKWFCPNITWFLPQNGYLKNSRGLQPPSPPSPRLACLCFSLGYYERHGKNSTLFSSTLFPASNTKCLKEIHLNEFIYKLFCLKIMQMQLKIAAQVALSKRTLLVSFAIMCYTKELCIRPDTRIFKSSHWPVCCSDIETFLLSHVKIWSKKCSYAPHAITDRSCQKYISLIIMILISKTSCGQLLVLSSYVWNALGCRSTTTQKINHSLPWSQPLT